MKATPHRFMLGAHSVTDSANGCMYTVRADQIERHQYQHGRVKLVPVTCPELAARILAAVAACPKPAASGQAEK